MLLLLVLPSCYSAIPITTAPPEGTELVLEMTGAATERMGAFLGRGVTSVRGRLVSWDQDSIVVHMIATESAQGIEQLWSGERVSVPREAVARVVERRPNRGRTGALVAGAVALVATAFTIVTGGRDGPSGGGTKPPPQ